MEDQSPRYLDVATGIPTGRQKRSMTLSTRLTLALILEQILSHGLPPKIALLINSQKPSTPNIQLLPSIERAETVLQLSCLAAPHLGGGEILLHARGTFQLILGYELRERQHIHV